MNPSRPFMDRRPTISVAFILELGHFAAWGPRTAFGLVGAGLARIPSCLSSSAGGAG
jgi:hypothetical protein